MVVIHLQNCPWHTSPSICKMHLAHHLMRVKRTRRWCITKSTSRGVCNGDVTLAPGVGKHGAKTLQSMLTCSEVLQRRSPKDGFKKSRIGRVSEVWAGGFLRFGRHKDICRVLIKWREVVKDGVAPDSCAADLVAFWQRKSAHP
jgi:hypothetical protein